MAGLLVLLLSHCANAQRPAENEKVGQQVERVAAAFAEKIPRGPFSSFPCPTPEQIQQLRNGLADVLKKYIQHPLDDRKASLLVAGFPSLITEHLLAGSADCVFNDEKFRTPLLCDAKIPNFLARAEVLIEWFLKQAPVPTEVRTAVEKQIDILATTVAMQIKEVAAEKSISVPAGFVDTKRNEMVENLCKKIDNVAYPGFKKAFANEEMEELTRVCRKIVDSRMSGIRGNPQSQITDIFRECESSVIQMSTPAEVTLPVLDKEASQRLREEILWRAWYFSQQARIARDARLWGEKMGNHDFIVEQFFILLPGTCGLVAPQ